MANNIHDNNGEIEDPVLPFETVISDAVLIEMFETAKDKVIKSLESNHFSENMIKHVNEFSKNNYTCGYYQENGLYNLSKKHLPDCLKAYHHNIASFNKNGPALASFLECLIIIIKGYLTWPPRRGHHLITSGDLHT